MQHFNAAFFLRIEVALNPLINVPLKSKVYQQKEK